MNQCCICIYHICCIICYIQLIIYCTTPQSGSTHMSRKPFHFPFLMFLGLVLGWSVGVYTYSHKTLFYVSIIWGKKKTFSVSSVFEISLFLRMTSSLNFYVLIKSILHLIVFPVIIWLDILNRVEKAKHGFGMKAPRGAHNQ